MSITVTAPNAIPADAPRPWIFLAGSIELGQAERWQDLVIAELADLPMTLLNPRRDAWDATWRNDLDDLRFAEQVTWELAHLDQTDLIIWYAVPGTVSSISLLELGLHAANGKILVCCPAGFQRHGNVAAVCQRFHLPLYDNLHAVITACRLRFESFVTTP